MLEKGGSSDDSEMHQYVGLSNHGLNDRKTLINKYKTKKTTRF